MTFHAPLKVRTRKYAIYNTTTGTPMYTTIAQTLVLRFIEPPFLDYHWTVENKDCSELTYANTKPFTESNTSARFYFGQS